MGNHYLMHHLTISISILHLSLNKWSGLIACSLKAKIHSRVILNRCAHKNRWKVAEDSKGITSTYLSKWRNRAIGIHTAGCRQQDVVQQFNVYPSAINRLLSHFRWMRQNGVRWCHRRQLKTPVRQDHCIVTMFRCNRFVSAPKVASELHVKLIR
jgi:hypothetical protein